MFDLILHSKVFFWKNFVLKLKFSKVIEIWYRDTLLFHYSNLRIYWRLSTILETSSKSVWSNIFWYVKACIFWKYIQYTIYWDKTQNLKKFHSDKINGTKNILSFLLGTLTHHSFTFNLRFLYELKHKVRLSKTMCEIFHFRSRFVFVKVCIFVQQNAWILSL